MPKLKALKSEEDLKAVPVNEPVLVDLGPIDESLVKSETDVDTDSILKQMEDMKTAQAEWQRQAEQAMKERDDALAKRQEAESQANQYRTSKVQSDIDMVSSQLQTAQIARDAAKRDIEAAGAAGDLRAQSDAYSRLGRAEAQILNCEAVHADLEERAKHPPEQRQEIVADPMRQIELSPTLTPKEKTWLKEHPELVIDPDRGAELRVAHKKAIAKGYDRGTSKYFSFLESFLGYEDEAGDTDEEIPMSAAPVSRSSVSSSVTGSKIKLSPAQRELAASMGLSDVEYARGVLRMEHERRADPEKFADRR